MSTRDMVARRSNYDETADFIPTPPYALRALFEHVYPQMKGDLRDRVALEPAMGQGHMLRTLREYCDTVKGCDLHEYDWIEGVEYDDWLGRVDFTNLGEVREALGSWHIDAVITNPPYKCINDFVGSALEVADRYVALLTRIQFLEGQTRYHSLFRDNPPTVVGVFSDRIPFKSGEVVRKAPKMFLHCWCVWDKAKTGEDTMIKWIPPHAQKRLEKDEDYEQ